MAKLACAAHVSFFALCALGASCKRTDASASNDSTPAAASPPPIFASFDLETVATELTAPLVLTSPPDGSGRRFIADQTGTIRILTPEGRLLVRPFLDLHDRMVKLNPGYDERGLLGFAFHPKYAQNGRLFVHYSAPASGGPRAGVDHVGVFAEYRVSSSDPDLADPASERVLLRVDQPQMNHNGGSVVFGPDGYLYLALGDGGASADQGPGHADDWYERNKGGNGQDIEKNLLGSILRIDVDHGAPYEVPQDNPFVGKPGLDEIWAFGFRNPYRISFDARSGALYAGDVGQALWEEVDLVVKGGNYGWNVKEGRHCFDAEESFRSLPSCPDVDPTGSRLLDPVIEFGNSGLKGGLGLSVIGGYVYRGAALPSLAGKYVFGAWSSNPDQPSGRIFVATPDPATKNLWPFQEIVIGPNADRSIGHFLLSFGEDDRGELYLLTSDKMGPSGQSGRVLRLQARR